MFLGKYSLVVSIVLTGSILISAQACTVTIDELAIWSG